MKNLKKYFLLANYSNYFSRLVTVLKGGCRLTYSQHGEDILIKAALKMLGVEKPSYLDIGTNYPVLGNNTHLFYSQGSKGVCIEPNPELFELVIKSRKRDICLNIGIGIETSKGLDFYVMSGNALSTFVKSEAEKYVRENNYGTQKIEKVIKVPVMPVNFVLRDHFPNGVDVISLDTEGYDFEILKSFDFKKYRPKVFCIETLRYEKENKLKKQDDIIAYMIEQGYFLYADTYVNSIFVDKKIWSF